jgi:hypothetical protein
MNNVMIGSVNVNLFKNGDKVKISSSEGGGTGVIMTSIYPGKVLVKTKSGLYYMDPKHVKLKTKGTSNATVYTFAILEKGDINEDSGLAEYQKIKTVKIKRADMYSALNYLRGKYSYKNTGKQYMIEPLR